MKTTATKAVAAFICAFGSTLGVELSSGKVSISQVLVAVGAGLVTAFPTYVATNKPVS